MNGVSFEVLKGSLLTAQTFEISLSRRPAIQQQIADFHDDLLDPFDPCLERRHITLVVARYRRRYSRAVGNLGGRCGKEGRKNTYVLRSEFSLILPQIVDLSPRPPQSCRHVASREAHGRQARVEPFCVEEQ